MRIGSNIKKLRTSKGMTQKNLADSLNVSSQAVSRWENDEVEPDISTLSKLSSIFEVPVDAIINGNFDVSEKENTQAENVTENKTSIASSESVEQRRPLGVCYDCKKILYAGDVIKPLNRKFPDGHYETKDLCENCYNKRISEKRLETVKTEKYKCEICGKPVYSGEEKTISIRRGRGHIRKHVCTECCRKEVSNGRAHEVKPEAQSSTTLSGKKNVGKKRMIFGILGGIATLILVMVLLLINTKMNPAGVVFLSIFLGYGVLSTVYCIFTECFVCDLFTDIASFSIKMPGIIFSFDLDGLAFLIAAKIFFAILGFLLGIGVIIFAFAISMIFSLFTFPFVIGKEAAF